MWVQAEAREVAGFDCSVIPAMTDEQKAYLADYRKRVNDDDKSNDPQANEDMKKFAHVVLETANHFKDLSDALDPEGKEAIYKKVDLNFEDQAEANYLRYLELKSFM